MYAVTFFVQMVDYIENQDDVIAALNASRHTTSAASVQCHGTVVVRGRDGRVLFELLPSRTESGSCCERGHGLERYVAAESVDMG